MLTESQLLQCLRTNLKKVSASDDKGERLSLLGAADIVINELLLREDAEFYAGHYNRGKILAGEGTVLAKSRQCNVSTADVYIELDKHSAIPQIEQQIQALTNSMRDVINVLPASGDEKVAAYLDDVNQWEIDLFARSMEDLSGVTSATGSSDQTEITAERFQSYLKQKFPEWKDVRVTKFSPLHGGFSKKTIMVDIEDQVNGKQSLVLRVQQENVMWDLYAGQIPDEYRIVKLAYDAGAKLSEPVWVEDDKSLLGCYFLVSRLAPGRNLGSATGAREAITDSMVKSFAQEIARVHNLDLTAYPDHIKGSVLEPWLETKDIAANTVQNIAFWRGLTVQYELDGSTLIERGLRWLEDNIEPCTDEPVLLHGDYGIHNVLVEDERVSAILDWEVSHIGDPAEEISWFLSCTAGAVDRELFLTYYREAGGKPFSEYRLRYFDVLNCLKLPMAGTASVAALNRQPDNIQFAVFALRYVHHGANRMLDAIKHAEAIKSF